MQQNHEICDGKEGCRYKVTTACNCTDSVLFFCQLCARSHSSKPLSHNFISLELARELVSSSLNPYSGLYPRYTKIKTDVQRYIKRLQEFKGKVVLFKKRILREVEAAIQGRIDKINSLIDYGNLKLAGLNKKKEEIGQIEAEIIDEFEELGIRAIIHQYLNNYEIYEEEIKASFDGLVVLDVEYSAEEEEKLSPPKPINAVKKESDNQAPSHRRSTSSLSNSSIRSKSNSPPKDLHVSFVIPDISNHSQPQYTSSNLINPMPISEPISQPIPEPISSDSIYSIGQGTSDLIKYTISQGTLSILPLSSYIKHRFYYTSTCLLPHNQLLICGGWDGVMYHPYTHRDTYKVDLNTENLQVTRLANLNYSRCCIRLVCNQDMVYALGGIDIENDSHSKKAEKMSLNGVSWAKMPDMKEARCAFGVYLKENRIYIMGGLFNNTVEYYDEELNRFEKMSNVLVPVGGVICAELNERIYVVGRECVIVMNREFERVEKKEREKRECLNYYDEVGVEEGKIVFLDPIGSKVWQIEKEQGSLKMIKEF
jgi:hypothetical protein